MLFYWTHQTRAESLGHGKREGVASHEIVLSLAHEWQQEKI